jgi:hypothetical protein
MAAFWIDSVNRRCESTQRYRLSDATKARLIDRLVSDFKPPASSRSLGR